MNNFKDVFISYGRRESLGFVGRLHQKLKLAGYDGWFDKVNIPDGDDYAHRINHGIESAHNFVYVMAPRCMTSPYCLIELEYARLLGKRVIPINQMVLFETDSQELSDGDKQVMAGFYQFYNLPDQNIQTTQNVLNRSHALIGRTDWLDAKEKVSDEECQRLVNWAQPYENNWAKHDDINYLKSFQFPVFGETIDTLDSVVERIITVIERQTDYIYQHTKILSQALWWQENQKATQHLLVGKERIAAEEWLLTEFLPPKQPPCTPSALVCEFLCESRKNAENLMTDIFICYDVENRPIRDGIIQSLSRYAKTTWTHERDIQKGADYGQAIQHGIETADNFFYCISPRSVISEYCQQELAHALKYQKRIVPLLIESTPESDIPFAVRSLQYIDFTDQTEPTDYHHHIDDILNILHRDQEYYQQHKILLARALKWQTENNKPSFLLRGHNLEKANTWLHLNDKREQHPPTVWHQQLITASEAAKGQLSTEVFISYSRKDGDFARQLNMALQEAGKTTWFDQESISSGMDFEQEIFKGIDSADNFLFVLSPDAVISEYCEREVNYAVSRGKRFITVLHRDTDPQTMPEALRVINWIDFADTEFEKSFPELIQVIELDREHAHQHTILQQRANDWEDNNRSKDFLLNITACDNAEIWQNTAQADNKQPAPTQLQQEFIAKSRWAIKTANRRRNALLMTATSGMIIAVILAIFAFIQMTNANHQTQLALESKQEAEYQTQQAQEANQKAIAALAEAKRERDKAQQALAMAERQRLEAERQKQMALKAQAATEQALAEAEYQKQLALEAQAEAEEALDMAEEQKTLTEFAWYDAEQQRVKAEHQKTLAQWSENKAEERSLYAAYQAKVALSEKKKAEIQRREAEKQKQQAMSAQQQAQQASAESEIQRQKAEDAKKDAEKRTQEANQAKAETEEQANIALISQLNAQALIAAEWPSPSNGSFDRTVLVAAQLFQMNKKSGQDTLLRVMQNPQLKTHLYGHTASVSSVAISPNGKLLASASWDTTVRMWDIEKQIPLGEPLRGHTDKVWDVAFSPDGKLLASASRDKTVRLWNVETKLPFGEPLSGHSGWVMNVAFNVDGKLLASVSDDKTVRIWDVETRKLFGEPLYGHTKRIRCVAFSPNGKLLASAGVDKNIRVWNVNTQKSIISLEGHTSTIKSIAFSPDSKTLASAGDDQMIILWNLDTQKTIITKFKLEKHTDDINSISFSSDGKFLASASDDNTIRWWDVEKKIPLGELRGHTFDVKSVAFGPNVKQLASGSWDKRVILWNIDTNSSLSTPLYQHKDDVKSVSFSPDGKLLASASKDNTIILWNMETKAPFGQLSMEQVNQVLFSPNGKRLVSASNQIILWDVETQTSIGKLLKEPTDRINHIAFNPEGTLLASASADKTIKLWDIEKQISFANPLEGHTDEVYNIAFNPDGTLLASASGDKTVRLWNVATQKLVGKPLQGHTLAVYSVAFHPNGKFLISAGDDDTVRIWDVKTQTLIGEPLIGHTGAVFNVIFSPDGKYLASASIDNTIRLWNINKQEPIGEPLKGHIDNVNSITFSPDSKFLVSASNDNEVRLWDMLPESWFKKFCQIANRNLSQEEWQEYFKEIPHQKTCPKLPKDTLGALEFITQAEKFAQEGKLNVAQQKFLNAKQLDERLVTFDIKATVKQIFVLNLIYQGETLAEQGKIPEAITKFEQAQILETSLYFDPETKVKKIAAQSLIFQGEELVYQGKREQAIAKFLEAQTLDASLDFDPETKAKKIAAQSLIFQGEELVYQGKREQAIAKFLEAQTLDASLYFDPETKVQQIIATNLVVPKEEIDNSYEAVIQGEKLAVQGKIEQAIVKFEEIKSHVEIPADSWDTLCWYGNLYQQAQRVESVCEQAVALQPQNLDYQIHRGLNRALLGHNQKAIEDFQNYLQQIEDYQQEVQVWIETLENGDNPFSTEVLEAWR